MCMQIYVPNDLDRNIPRQYTTKLYVYARRRIYVFGVCITTSVLEKKKIDKYPTVFFNVVSLLVALQTPESDKSDDLVLQT